jgi:large subunit ribosomal protein L6
MSKIGKKPVVIPAGVEVQQNGNHIQVKGPKGTLEWDIPAAVTAKIE